jgi:hypothetical protein
MQYDPSKKDWAIADALWELLEAMPRNKARSYVTSLISGSPVSVEAARNILREESK